MQHKISPCGPTRSRNNDRGEFLPFKEADVEILTPVMKHAFDADAQFRMGRDGDTERI